MIMEIKDALKTLDKSNKCKVLIFTGEGDVFLLEQILLDERVKILV